MPTIGFGENASLMSVVVTGVVDASSTFILTSMVDKLDQRILFTVGGLSRGYSYLSETKNVPIEQMDRVWREK